MVISHLHPRGTGKHILQAYSSGDIFQAHAVQTFSWDNLQDLFNSFPTFGGFVSQGGTPKSSKSDQTIYIYSIESYWSTYGDLEIPH